MLNARKILVLLLIFIILCIAGIHWTHKAKKIFYVNVEVPFSYYKTSQTIQTESLIDKLQLIQAIEWLYLPKFRQSTLGDENSAIINSIQLVKAEKDKTQDRGKFIVSLQGIYSEKTVQIEHLLSDFVIFIENSVNQITAPLNLSIQDQIKAAKHSHENLLKQSKLAMENQLKSIKDNHAQEMEVWQANLSFQQNQQKEIESMIAEIEKSVISADKENNIYFLIKQDFLYKKLYATQEAIFSFQEKIKNADNNLAIQVGNIKRQNELSLIQINDKSQSIIMGLEAELKTINKAHAVYYFSEGSKGISLPALYLLSFLLSLILAVVSAYIISLFANVRKVARLS